MENELGNSKASAEPPAYRGISFGLQWYRLGAGEKYEGIKEAPLSMVIPIMIAAIISVLIGIFPGFMMNFVDRVTPDNVAVSMPQYNPAGAPLVTPPVKVHGEPLESHGAAVESHGNPEESHSAPVESHGEPAGH